MGTEESVSIAVESDSFLETVSFLSISTLACA